MVLVMRVFLVLAGALLLYACSDPEPRVIQGYRHTPSTDVVSLGVAASRGRLHVVWVEEGTPHTAFHSVSRDHGQTWSEPVAIATDQPPPNRVQRSNDIRIAAIGDRLVVVWQTQGEGFQGAGPMVMARSADGGLTWRAVAAPAGVEDAPAQGFFALSVDPAERFHLAWLDNRSGQQGLHHAHSVNGIEWTAVTTVTPETCECCWNNLAHTAEHTYLLYRGKNPRDMRLAITPDLREWHGHARVGEFDWQVQGCPHMGGGIAVNIDDEKGLHALVWTGHERHAGVHYLRGDIEGRGWQRPHRIGSSGAGNPDLALLSDGRLIAVWDQGGSEAGVYAAWIADGRAGTGLRLSDAPQARYPWVVGTPDGAAVVWTERAENGRMTWTIRALD